MPLDWTCIPDRSLLAIDGPASFISFQPKEGVSPQNIQIRCFFTADIEGNVPVDDSQLRILAHVTAQSGADRMRAPVSLPLHEPRLLSDLAREGFKRGDYTGLQLTLAVISSGPDSLVRTNPMPLVLRAWWAGANGDGADSGRWQLVWNRKTQQHERRVLALGFDLGTSSDSVSAIVQEVDTPSVMYLLEDTRADFIGRLSFVRDSDVGPGYRNPDSDIVALLRWSGFPDREVAVTAPEHTLNIMSSAHGGASGAKMALLRRLKACMQFFQGSMLLADRWPYSQLSVANLINRIRYVAPLTPCVVRPGVLAYLTFSFSFSYDAACQLAREVKTYCDSADPAIAIPEGQAAGLAFVSRAIRKYASATQRDERQMDAVRKCLCQAFGLPRQQHHHMERLQIVSQDVGDGTAEACLQCIETSDDPQAPAEGLNDRALIRSTATLYWAEPFCGGGRVTVLTRTLFVLRLILRIFDQCEDGQQFYGKLAELMRGFGLQGASQHRQPLPVSAGQLVELWPLALALAERALVGDPDIMVSVAPNVDYFRKLAERRFKCVRDEKRQFVTYALDVPSDVASIREFLENFATESLLGRPTPPPYVAAAERLLASWGTPCGMVSPGAQETADAAREVVKWMVNTLFDFNPDARDTVDESRLRQRFAAALWEIAEQYKCQFPVRKAMGTPCGMVSPDGGMVSPAAVVPGEEEVIEEDAIRDPHWRYEQMGSREMFVPSARHEKWYLFENLREETRKSGSPGAALIGALPAAEQKALFDGDLRQNLAALLAIPPLSLFRHTVVPTYVALHNAFGLFYQVGEQASAPVPRFFVPSGRGTAFAVYQYLLNTYVLAHYGAEMLLHCVPEGSGAMGAPRVSDDKPTFRLGAVPIIRGNAEDVIGLKHAQVDGALCSILIQRTAPISVRVEHTTASAPFFPYAVRYVERGGTDADVLTEELLEPGPWHDPQGTEYANPAKVVHTAGGGLRHVEFAAGYDAAVETSMVFSSPPLSQAFAGPDLTFYAAASHDPPQQDGDVGESPEHILIAQAYRNLVPPAVRLYCHGPDATAQPQTFVYRVHEDIELPNIFMEHETALLR